MVLILTNLATDCSITLTSTPFCANAPWELWFDVSNTEGPPYFCCLQGETGLLGGACVSNQEVITTSLEASFVSYSSRLKLQISLQFSLT
jgi:hypothetical protein